MLSILTKCICLQRDLNCIIHEVRTNTQKNKDGTIQGIKTLSSQY